MRKKRGQTIFSDETRQIRRAGRAHAGRWLPSRSPRRLSLFSLVALRPLLPSLEQLASTWHRRTRLCPLSGLVSAWERCVPPVPSKQASECRRPSNDLLTSSGLASLADRTRLCLRVRLSPVHPAFAKHRPRGADLPPLFVDGDLSAQNRSLVSCFERSTSTATLADLCATMTAPTAMSWVDSPLAHLTSKVDLATSQNASSGTVNTILKRLYPKEYSLNKCGM